MASLPPFSLTDLDAATVEAYRLMFSQRLTEAFPSVDADGGAVRSLVIAPYAAMAAAHDRQIAAYLAARSPLSVDEADAQAVDPAAVDHLLSNYLFAAREGQQASGDIYITVNSTATVVIGSGQVFEAAGVRYLSNQVYTAKIDPAQVESGTGDRLMTAIGNGLYRFTITVTAAEAADNTALQAGEVLTPVTPPRNFVSSTVVSGFTGGFAAESGTAALSRLRASQSPAAPANRDGFNALLSREESLTNAIRGSVVGFGDTAMLRDRHPITGIPAGGRADWYVRGSELPLTLTKTYTATFAGPGSSGGWNWSVFVGANDAPGFYDVTAIRPSSDPGAASKTIVSDTRSKATEDATGLVPDLPTDVDAAYSRYQTATIVFNDASTNTGGVVPTTGDTRSYDLDIRYVPLVGTAQDLIASRSRRSTFGDVLVRAPIPCFVSLAITLEQRGSEVIDTDAIKQAAAGAINAIGFTGMANAAAAQKAVWPLLPADVELRDIQLVGRLRAPDGQWRFITDPRGDRVVIDETWADKAVTPQTVQFYTGTSDVGITVLTITEDV